MSNLMVFIVAATASYWYETEIFLFLGAAYNMVHFLHWWYKPILRAWPPNQSKAGRYTLGCLPVAAAALILSTLLTMASFDVVGVWVVFYIILGYVWLYGGVYLIEYCLGFSWTYDTINLNNKAAVFTAAGGFIGLTLIYSGANIGDGPGWWVVFIAGGLGLVGWLGLAMLINLAVGVTERTTVERDAGCGIRFGAYLLASGLILARASGGDWTSLQATLAEFLVGWPVLPLAALALLVEQWYIRFTHARGNAQITSSVLWGCIYLAYAVIALMMLPSFSENSLGSFYMVLS